MPLEIRCDGSREESGSLKQIESALSLDAGVRCTIAGVGFLLHCLPGQSVLVIMSCSNTSETQLHGH